MSVCTVAPRSSILDQITRKNNVLKQTGEFGLETYTDTRLDLKLHPLNSDWLAWAQIHIKTHQLQIQSSANVAPDAAYY